MRLQGHTVKETLGFELTLMHEQSLTALFQGFPMLCTVIDQAWSGSVHVRVCTKNKKQAHFPRAYFYVNTS